MLITFLIAIELAKLLLNTKKTNFIQAIEEISVRPVLISLVTFSMWISSYVIFGHTIRNLIKWLSGEIYQIPRVKELEYIIQLKTLTIIELFLKMYGKNMVFLILSLIAGIIIIKRVIFLRNGSENLFILLSIFLVSGPAWILIFASTFQITLGRLFASNFVLWPTPVLVGFIFYEFSKKTKLYVFFVTLLLMVSSVISIFGVFPSPWVYQPNLQITKMDFAGKNWFYINKDPNLDSGTLGIPPALLIGKIQIPQHFNYSYHSSLGELYPHNFYLIYTHRIKLVNEDPVLSKTLVSDRRLVRLGFNRTDFIKLEKDSGVNQIYSNGEFEIQLVKQKGEFLS